jgi:hypothetical protein
VFDRTPQPVAEVQAFKRMPAGGTTNREPRPEAETTLERIGQLQDDLDTAEDRLKHERGIWWVAMDGLQAENERLVDEVSRLQAELGRQDVALARARRDLEDVKAERRALWELLKLSVRTTRDVIRHPAPRWDQDPVVLKFGWLDGRCGKCGEELPAQAGTGDTTQPADDERCYHLKPARDCEICQEES